MVFKIAVKKRKIVPIIIWREKKACTHVNFEKSPAKEREHKSQWIFFTHLMSGVCVTAATE